MRGGLHHEAEARVTVMITDSSDYSKKEIIQLTTFDQISSSISLDGIGSATISFNNKRIPFLKGVQWPKWAMQNSDDVKLFKQASLKFASEMNDPTAEIPLMYAQKDQLLVSKINAFDRLWIDYRGRDGLWYPGFTGIVTGYADSRRAKGTPTFTIVAKDFKRILQSTPIVYGLNNINDFDKIETVLTSFQTGSITTKNIFSNKYPSLIIADVIDVINKMLNIQPKDSKTFWGYRKPDDKSGKIPSGEAIYQKMFGDFYGVDRHISPYQYRKNEFDIWAGRSDPDAVVSSFYRNPMGFAFHDEMFKDGAFIYQMVLRSQLEQFVIDQESALSIFNKVAQATFSSIYIDQAGNLRYEYPRYETMPSLSNDVGSSGMLNGEEDHQTLWHGLNYWISSSDSSFMGFKVDDNESNKVATRASVEQSYAYANIDPGNITKKYTMAGYTTEPEDVLLRYGLREANINTFFSTNSVSTDVLSKYVQSAMVYLNSKARGFSVSLNQRPDLMLNRNIVFLDRALVGLITDISDTFSPATGHIRSLTCRYMRNVGEKLAFPWRDLLGQSIESSPGNTSQV